MIILTIGTPKKVPLILGNPHLNLLGQDASEPSSLVTANPPEVNRGIIIGLYGDNGKENGNPRSL